jgi:excisionase family DNA binding protein
MTVVQRWGDRTVVKLFGEVKVYTVQDVADQLRIKRETVFRYIREGKLKARRMGKAYLITKNNLISFINAAGKAKPR